MAREAVRDVGYTRAKFGFDADTCAVLSALHGQSPDIAMGVDPGGAGDQGLMFGYACSETKELMPLPIMLAHRLVRGLSSARRTGELDYLRPDGKSQVTVEYDGNRPVRVDTVVVSSQHSEEISTEQIREDVTTRIIKSIVPSELIDEQTTIHVNPTGRFVTGGPHGDAGVTGRKIIVDTYGGMAPHGGGAFSGKDPTKVDRSACYMTRYIAKNCVAAGLADRVQVQLAYAIGVADSGIHSCRDLPRRAKSTRPRSSVSYVTTFSSLRRVLSSRLTFVGLSIGRPLRLVTSGAQNRSSPGSGPTRLMPCGRRPACRSA